MLVTSNIGSSLTVSDSQKISLNQIFKINSSVTTIAYGLIRIQKYKNN